MNLHEYQAKELLKTYGVPVPPGKAASTPKAAAAAAAALGGAHWVVKAQVHAGGRGKAGGIRLCSSEQEVWSAADDLVGTSDPVMIDRQQVGTITSGARSPILRKNIALCRMSIEHSEIGTEVEVGKMDGHQKRLPATVVRFPHYDPDKERVRS